MLSPAYVPTEMTRRNPKLWRHQVGSCTCKSGVRRRITDWTNLDSILKSRGITLPTKVHLVEALVFPVVMYGCESCTIKKAER